MKVAEFKEFQKGLEHLTDSQLNYLEQLFSENNRSQQITQELEQRLVEKPECPHCHSHVINRHGKMPGNIQRYRCKNCLKTFNARTGTPLARLHFKERWMDYIQCMIEGKTLRVSASACHIDVKTAFRWRHRLLELPATLKAQVLEGIVEMDETAFRYSEKGNKTLSRPGRKRGSLANKAGRSKEDWVPVLTARDRGKHTIESVLKDTSFIQIDRELQGKIEPDSILCSDGLRSYQKIANQYGLVHKQLNLSAKKRVIERVFHIQNVNAYHSRLKNWMRRFKGVATKYLENYLGWYRFLDTAENPNEKNLFKIQQQLVGT